jgi:hypothetical protein
VQVRVLHSDVGHVDESRLQLLASIVAFLVQARCPKQGTRARSLFERWRHSPADRVVAG